MTDSTAAADAAAADTAAADADADADDHTVGPDARRLTVVVGMCGGIAAYKAVSVVRELVLRGHDVHVVPTEAALRFVGAPTLEAISRNPVHTSVFDDVAQVRHVALGQQADLIVVAPATAHTLAKLAHGLSDDLLGTTVLASTAPLVVAPAMHTQMWQAASTTDNVALLRSRGVVVVGPDGPLTGGDSGPGRLSEPDVIVDAALAVVAGRAEEARGRDLTGRDLTGRLVVVTAGGTREPLDPVRWLGNRSSGKQGLAVAREATARGARVVFVAAHVDDDVAAAVAQLPGTEVRTAGTAAELDVATTAAAEGADVVVMAAAVADWTPASVADAKLKKDDAGDRLTLDLLRTVDVLAGLVARRRAGQVVVGFAAETSTGRDDLIALGRRKLARKPADLLVLNQVGWAEGFGRDESVAVLLGHGGVVVGESSGTKADTARALLDAVVSLLGAASATAPA